GLSRAKQGSPGSPERFYGPTRYRRYNLAGRADTCDTPGKVFIHNFWWNRSPIVSKEKFT
ncbi:hypothetical protein, partial [uncultured Varibaculum sp.]|uniref:hypothetical protein n=1 Tax=uncultured Varibaculum sp. TaxID=413896 RepID=UPI002593C3BB